MAFPQVQSTSSGNSGANVTSQDITLPSGISAGDLILIFFNNDGAQVISVTSPASGWEGPVGQDVSPSNSNRLSVLWRWADGSEGATITVSISSTEGCAWTCYRISGADQTTDPELSTATTGTSTAPNSGSLSPSWGAEDTLWFSVYGWDGNQSHSTYPTNYGSNQLTDRWANVAGAGIASASRELNASSEDPGAGAIGGSDQWVAYTVAVRPQGDDIIEDVENNLAFDETLDLTSFPISNETNFEIDALTLTTEFVEQSLAFIETLNLGATVVYASNVIGFVQLAETNYFVEDVSNNLGLDVSIGYNWVIDVIQYLGFVGPRTILPITTTLGLFAETHQQTIETVNQSLGFTELLGRAYLAINELQFSQTIFASQLESIIQNLALESTADSSDTEFGRTGVQSCIKQHLTYSVSGRCIEKEYSPLIGTSGDSSYGEVSATVPTIDSAKMTLTYPYVTPTTTLVMKNPTFNNSDSLRFRILDNKTRGGDRILFGDPKWSKTEVLSLTVENICTPEIDTYIDFLNDSLGKEVGLLDWEDRQWRGVIIAPESEIRKTTGGYAVTIVFQGQLA